MNEDENTVEYWKAKYEELNTQFDEYQRHSYELENELELQLKHSDEKIKDLETKNNRLALDNDTLKSKLNELNVSTHKQISQLQEDSAKLKAVKDEMQKYIRELEQKNDDLERTNRCAMFSLGEFESKLNEALERNAILESELDEKDELAETVQRLRDEARDLKQELAVRQQKSHHQKDVNMSMQMDTSDVTHSQAATTNSNPIVTQQNTLNHILNELNLQQQQQQQQQTKTASNLFFNSPNKDQQPPVSTSLRISALNFVGDALRKVTSMESRLVASRTQMKESNRDRRSATISSFDSSG